MDGQYEYNVYIRIVPEQHLLDALISSFPSLWETWPMKPMTSLLPPGPTVLWLVLISAGVHGLWLAELCRLQEETMVSEGRWNLTSILGQDRWSREDTSLSACRRWPGDLVTWWTSEAAGKKRQKCGKRRFQRPGVAQQEFKIAKIWPSHPHQSSDLFPWSLV